MGVAPHRHLPERPPLVSVEVHPAAADRFPDVATILAPAKPSTPACWCLTYRITNAENHTLRGPDRPERLRGLCHADPPPGMIAYVDGVPAGWCSFGPRSSFNRLVKARTIPHVDETPAWSVICFIVRPQFRRTGLSRALLDAVVDYAKGRSDVPVLEAYPIDSTAGRVSASFAYVGTTSLFEAAGFKRVTLTSARSGGADRWLMRRPMTKPS